MRLFDVISAGMLPQAARGNREDRDLSHQRQGEPGQGPGAFVVIVHDFFLESQVDYNVGRSLTHSCTWKSRNQM